MENNSLFPLKYRLRKTDELVEIVAWETIEKGERNENDWVSYIDSRGMEHIKEHLTLEWDFVIQTPFEKGFFDAIKPDLPTFDPWEARRYELVKEYVMRDLANDRLNVNADKAVAFADDIIAALKKSPEVIGEEYENIGVGAIVEAIDGPERLKKFVFTDKKDIVGFKGDSGRWSVGDRVKVYIKHLDPAEEERPVP